MGRPDVREARSPVNFREGRRASDEYLASANNNNAVPFRQRLRESSKPWVQKHKEEEEEDEDDVEQPSKSKICKLDVPEVPVSPSKGRLQRVAEVELADGWEEGKRQDSPPLLYQRLQTLHLNNIFSTTDLELPRSKPPRRFVRQASYRLSQAPLDGEVPWLIEPLSPTLEDEEEEEAKVANEE